MKFDKFKLRFSKSTFLELSCIPLSQNIDFISIHFVHVNSYSLVTFQAATQHILNLSEDQLYAPGSYSEASSAVS